MSAEGYQISADAKSQKIAKQNGAAKGVPGGAKKGSSGRRGPC